MYNKVVLLSLFGEPQCSSVWGVEPFARLLLCLTHPENFNEQLSGTSKWSEIWLSGTPKWSEIWLSGTLKWSEIWLSGTPKWSEISIMKKFKMHFLELFFNQKKFFCNFFFITYMKPIYGKSFKIHDTLPLSLFGSKYIPGK